MTLDSIPDGAKHALDALAAVAAIGAVAQMLPPIAAALSIVWLTLQIYGWIETRVKAAKPPQN
jgi:hypothetical protein